MVRPIDMEVALADALAPTVEAYPMPLPHDFATPCALVTRTGGETSPRGILNTHAMSVDIYADTWDEANAVASEVVDSVYSLRGVGVGGRTAFEVDCNLPYDNPDPRHESLARVTFTARITCRAL